MEQLNSIETADGNFLAGFSENGLSRLEFPSVKHARRGHAASPRDAGQKRSLKLTERALTQVLRGQAVQKMPPLDLSAGTPFQQSVWRELLAIPAGQTRTYQQIAAALGRPKAVRAVGGACGANPIPVLVPCHRVVAANRKLGGFSGGLAWKIKLLEREGSRPAR